MFKIIANVFQLKVIREIKNIILNIYSTCIFIKIIKVLNGSFDFLILKHYVGNNVTQKANKRIFTLANLLDVM